MRTTMMIAALAVGIATAATATPTTHHRRATSDTGSAAVRALNEKSLQQASAGTSGMPMGGQTGTAMSDSGTAAPMNGAPMNSTPANGPAMTPAPADAAPMAPTTPR